MVRGLDRFRDHFRGYEANYVLIGGTAGSLAMEEAGLQFRVTMDLDIVLCIEVLNVDFVGAFWDFIRAGRYKNRQKSSRTSQFDY
jgi:formylmethanofuran dehydrogenase subunit E